MYYYYNIVVPTMYFGVTIILYATCILFPSRQFLRRLRAMFPDLSKSICKGSPSTTQWQGYLYQWDQCSPTSTLNFHRRLQTVSHLENKFHFVPEFNSKIINVAIILCIL